MTDENPGGTPWPSPSRRSDEELALDPSTSPAVLSSLAEDRPGVRPLVAVNPSTPVHTLLWLRSLHDPVIDLALRRNPTASAAHVVRPGAADTTHRAGLGAAAISASVASEAADGAAAPAPASGTPAPGALVPGAPVPGAPVPAAGGRRFAAWAILVVPLLAALGLGAVTALVKDRSKSTTAGASSTLPALTSTLAPAAGASTQVTTAPATTLDPAASTAPAAPDPAATTPAPPTTAAPAPPTTARRPSTTRAATATTARPATTTTRPATTIAGATTSIRPTASVGSTTVPPTVLGTSVAPTTAVASAAGRTAATAVAQRLATALAGADWATARKLNPAGALSDAQYGKDYGTLTDSTVIPAKATVLGTNRYDLRLGLVAHETTPAGAQSTLLYCVHWNVDTAANTVVQVDGRRVRTVAGRVEASAVTAELTASCATAALS